MDGRAVSRRTFLVLLTATAAAVASPTIWRLLHDENEYFVAGSAADPQLFRVTDGLPFYGGRTDPQMRAEFVPAGSRPYVVHPVDRSEAVLGTV